MSIIDLNYILFPKNQYTMLNEIKLIFKDYYNHKIPDFILENLLFHYKKYSDKMGFKFIETETSKINISIRKILGKKISNTIEIIIDNMMKQMIFY